MTAQITQSQPRTIRVTTESITDSITQSATAREPYAVDAEGNPLQCPYDLPAFIGDGLKMAADAVNFWVGQHTADRHKDDARYQTNTGKNSEVAVLTDLHLYRPTRDLQFAEDLTVAAALREVLAHTIDEIHRLAATDRGHYLAQLLTRWFSDGHIDWLRFRLGHLLAVYYSMMPTVGHSLGLIDVDDEDVLVLGWQTPHGVYLDVVHQHRPDTMFVTADIAAVLAVGSSLWPADFAGVRYLPLDDLADARLYAQDGTWTSVVEQNLLAIAAELAHLG